MKRNKRKKIIIAFIVIILIVVAFFGTLYYITSTVNNYSYSEKRWINDNSNTTLDIYIEPNLPVYSNNGSGVFHDYLSALKENTGLNFNVITDDTSNIKLTNKNVLGNNDLVFYKDHYIVLGANNVNKAEDLNYKKVGVIESDKESVLYYLTEYKNINITSYENFDSLKTQYDSKAIDYMIVPMYKYLDRIILENYEIVFHLDGLYSYYVLESNSEENEELNSILRKFYYRWEEKSLSKKNEYFLNIYYDSKGYKELDKESITSEDFIVGYIDNLPYEGMIGKTFSGLTNTYLSKFSDMTGVTYKYVEYKDTKDLGNALVNNKIDLAMNYYSLSNDNYDNSRVLGPSEYVVLAHDKNNLVVNYN